MLQARWRLARVSGVFFHHRRVDYAHIRIKSRAFNFLKVNILCFSMQSCQYYDGLLTVGIFALFSIPTTGNNIKPTVSKLPTPSHHLIGPSDASTHLQTPPLTIVQLNHSLPLWHVPCVFQICFSHNNCFLFLHFQSGFIFIIFHFHPNFADLPPSTHCTNIIRNLEWIMIVIFSICILDVPYYAQNEKASFPN